MMQILWTLILWLLVAAATLYLLAVLGVFFFQHRLIYEPSRTLSVTPAEAGLPFEEVSLKAEDGVRLHGWFIPSPQSRGTLLFFHGNAGNISHRIETAARFCKWGLNTFLIDYRGYGKSEGKPSESGTRLDADAAWKFLVQTRRLPPEKILVLGRSLGSAVAADLVARVKPGGVILESGFSTLADLGAAFYPWLPIRLLNRHHYPTVENVTRFRCPVLIAHSREDELIPFHHGERIFQAAPEPKYFLEMIGTHSQCVSATGIPYDRAIKSFIDEALLIQPSESPE